MSEFVDVRRDGQLCRLPDLSSIKKGERYRISTEHFEGPWRKAAEDAQLKARGVWVVLPENSARGRNGYDG
jgi:hypothetical protein